MKRKLKFFACLLCSFSLFSTSINTIYANNVNDEIIEINDDINVEFLVNDNDEVKVKSVEDDKIIISTVDKKSNIMTIEKYDINYKNLLSTYILDLNEISSQESQDNLSRATYQNTFSNREYEYYNSYDSEFGRCIKWDIRSDYKRKNGIIETNSNSNNLKNFRDAVETINDKEKAIIFTASIGTLTTILTAFASGGIGAGIAAASTAGVAANFVIDLNRAINDADYYFYRIY